MELLQKGFGVKLVSWVVATRAQVLWLLFTWWSLLLTGNKTFAKQTVYDAHLKGGKHQKAAARLASGGPTTTAPSTSTSTTPSIDDKTKKVNRIQNLSSQEHLVGILAEELLSVRAETRSNVERKAALTEKERAAEAEAADRAANPQVGDIPIQEGEMEDDEDDDEKIYNPLKLPLGWDGKPIPYWLYKLHGLGVEFKCEICSDYVYQGRWVSRELKGAIGWKTYLSKYWPTVILWSHVLLPFCEHRKNFDRHFQEARHAFGMRALGLPNSKQFHEITKIEDALARKLSWRWADDFLWCGLITVLRLTNAIRFSTFLL